MILTKNVKKILIANIALFILSIILVNLNFPFFENFALWPIQSINYSPVQFITHMFLHGGLSHIFFNMLVLISFGPAIENYFTNNKFLLFYFVCGITASAFNMCLTNSNLPIVGASGALFGLLSSFILIDPNKKLYLFFLPIGIKSKYLISTYILFEVFNTLAYTNDGIAHYAHVGGAIAGILFYLIDKKLKKSNGESINT